MSSAARQRRLRDRQARGIATLSVEVDEVALVEMLIGGGLLKSDEADDRHALQAALARQIELLCRM